MILRRPIGTCTPMAFVSPRDDESVYVRSSVSAMKLATGTERPAMYQFSGADPVVTLPARCAATPFQSATDTAPPRSSALRDADVRQNASVVTGPWTHCAATNAEPSDVASPRMAIG